MKANHGNVFLSKNILSNKIYACAYIFYIIVQCTVSISYLTYYLKGIDTTGDLNLHKHIH